MNYTEFNLELNSKAVNFVHKYSLHNMDKDKLIKLITVILFNDIRDTFATRVDVSIDSEQRELLRKYEGEQKWDLYYKLIDDEFDIKDVLNKVNDDFENRLSKLLAYVNQ